MRRVARPDMDVPFCSTETLRGGGTRDEEKEREKMDEDGRKGRKIFIVIVQLHLFLVDTSLRRFPVEWRP